MAIFKRTRTLITTTDRQGSKITRQIRRCGCLKRIVVVDKTAQQRSPDLRSVLVTKLRDQDVLLLLFGRQKTLPVVVACNRSRCVEPA